MLRVLYLPYFENSAYLKQLAVALRPLGVDPILRSFDEKRPAMLDQWRRSGRPRVVHIQFPEHYLNMRHGGPGRRDMLRFLGTLLMFRVAGVRIVWTVNNRTAHDGRHPEREMLLYRALARSCAAIIVHCEEGRRWLVETLKIGNRAAGRVAILAQGNVISAYPNTVDRDAARARLGLEPTSFVFAFLGAIRPYKGVEALIDAFGRLSQPGLALVIAGRPRGQAVQAVLRAASAKDRRIELHLGYQPDEELQVILNAADAIVVPYQEDILTSGSVLLAMSFGRAVIAPRLGCLPETMTDGAGVLYDPSQPDALEAAMRSAIDGDVAAMGRYGLARVAEFDWATIAARTAALYGA